MIHGSVYSKDGKSIKTFEEKLRSELRKTVYMLGLDLEALVKQKLSGPVLKAPTGNLRGSVNTRVDEDVTSIIATVGTSLGTIPYARIHEYGGVILPKNGQYLIFKTADGAWHSVTKVTMPERSYMRSSLKEKAPNIELQLRNALKRAAAASGLITS